MSQGIHGFESHPCRNEPLPIAVAAPMVESPTLHLTAVATREDDWYVARCLEVEATSQGETVEQALTNLREVVEATWKRSRSRRCRRRW